VKRPKSRRPEIPADLTELAERCTYEGSLEHKDRRSWLGTPKPRRSKDPALMATICPLVSNKDRERATAWVQAAIRAGNFDRTDWQGGFSRHIWYRDEAGKYWYGFLTNSGAGEKPAARYKGWPISEEEWREIFG
jgi:hypothetical protein